MAGGQERVAQEGLGTGIELQSGVELQEGKVALALQLEFGLLAEPRLQQQL